MPTRTDCRFPRAVNGGHAVSDKRDPRRERLYAIIRDFFKDKPPGTPIEQRDLDDYYRRLREAAKEQT
jgi:hypothetical protein